MVCEAGQCAVVSNVYHLTDLSIFTPNRTGDLAYTLDLFLTSIPSIYSNISILLLLGSSGHCCYIISQLQPRNHPSSSGCIFWRDFLAPYPWNDCCVNSDVSNSTDIALQGMHLPIPHFSKPGKREFPEWFNRIRDHTGPLKRSTLRRWRHSPFFASH